MKLAIVQKCSISQIWTNVQDIKYRLILRKALLNLLSKFRQFLISFDQSKERIFQISWNWWFVQKCSISLIWTNVQDIKYDRIQLKNPFELLNNLSEWIRKVSSQFWSIKTKKLLRIMKLAFVQNCFISQILTNVQDIKYR